MRSFLPLSAALVSTVLTACTVQQENGQDLRISAPAILSVQPWHVTQQYISPDGIRTCTISSGAMDITQQAKDPHAVRLQVARAYPLNPGETYKVLVHGHNYETRDNWFNTKQSQAIIADMASSKVAYTEAQNQFIDINERRTFNTIELKTFKAKYRECEKFVHGAGQS